MIHHQLDRIFDRPQFRALHRAGMIQHEGEVERHACLGRCGHRMRLHEHIGKLAASGHSHALASYLTVQSYFASHLLSPFPFLKPPTLAALSPPRLVPDGARCAYGRVASCTAYVYARTPARVADLTPGLLATPLPRGEGAVGMTHALTSSRTTLMLSSPPFSLAARTIRSQASAAPALSRRMRASSSSRTISQTPSEQSRMRIPGRSSWGKMSASSRGSAPRLLRIWLRCGCS